MTFASPWAALVALAGLPALTLALVRGRSARRLRRALGLAEPPLPTRLVRPIALVCLFGLLGLAAAQPAIRHEQVRTARKDAELLVVLDSSRSMLASRTATSSPRYRRAATFAHRLRRAVPELPAGVASLTNRLLPYLFPTADARIYDSVLDEAYGIQRPRPSPAVEPWVTTFDPLLELTTRRFFSPSVHKRVVVVLSDLETHPFEAGFVLGRLRAGGVTPILVRFWRSDERIFRSNGSQERYRATLPNELAELRADGWPAYPETSLDRVAARVRRAIGSGPTGGFGLQRRDRSLASILALAAFAPLLLLIAPAGQLPLRRRLRPSRSAPDTTSGVAPRMRKPPERVNV
jgi:hypothetical protein